MASKKAIKGKTEVKTFEPVAYDEPKEGPKLTEVHLTETFTGDIQAESSARSLQAQSADGSASYCGVQRVVGTLDGRRGSFVLQHQGTLQAKQMKTTWFVVPGSGTGDLRGLRGEGGFEAELGRHGAWTLDYWFE
ncbi:MAG TPA: DUF3224 domain-containing protein [Polyangiales bacterium]|nr:DUF3224 domain-containing protein [Polyangiales bacterium]